MRHERHEALLSVTMRHERHVALRCVTKRHEIPTKKQVKRHDALRSVTSVTKTSRSVTMRHGSSRYKRHERHEGGIHDLAGPYNLIFTFYLFV